MLKLRIRNLIKKHLIDILYCLILLLVAFKFTHSLETIRDVELYDETFALYRGTKIFDLGLPQASWSPLYSIWYFLLSLFEHNNIALFYLNFKLLIFTTPLLFYIYLRTLKIRPIIAVFFAFIYSISSISLLTPRSGNFSVLIFLSFLAIANLIKNKIKFYFLIALAFLQIAFIRPEYSISFLIILFLYLLLLSVSIFYNSSNLKNIFFQFIFLAFCIILSVVLIGNPLAGGRSFIAFSEHFSFFWMERNNIAPNVDVNYYNDIIRSVFGDVNSISQALIANPREFFAHISMNFTSYFHHSISILLVNLQNDFSTIVNTSIRDFELISLSLVLLFIIVRLKISLKRINYIILKRIMTIFISIIIPVFISSLLINPRFHYLILQSIFILTLIAYFLENSLSLNIQKQTYKFWYPIVIGSILFILTPNLATGWCLIDDFCVIQRISTPETSRLPILKTIEFLQSLQIKNEVNILEADGGYHVYLSDRYHYVPESKKQENFVQFLQREKINMIVLTPALTRSSSFSKDEEFITFANHPEQWDFIKLKVPKTKIFLLLSSDLIDIHHIQN